MNILIVISSLHFGGAEKQVVDDANQLAKMDNVFLFTFENGPLEALLSKSVNTIITSRKNYYLLIKELLIIIKEKEISIIHAHLYAPMVISSLAGFFSKIPVIWNFHSHAYENSFKAKLVHKYVAKLPSVKKILFPATELDDYYSEQGYGFNKKKCILSYNSGQDIVKSEKLLLKKNKDIHLGFIGRIIPLKRIYLLLELAEYLVNNDILNFKIDIVGNGSEMEALIIKAKNLKLDKFIYFHGFQKDTLSFYRKFDIFVFPSGEEVLSLSLIDAGLSSIPAVAFDVGGNEEILQNGKTGFLVKSKDGFFKQIMYLIKQKNIRLEMGLAARSICYDKFSPKSRLDFLNSLYEEVI